MKSKPVNVKIMYNNDVVSSRSVFRGSGLLVLHTICILTRLAHPDAREIAFRVHARAIALFPFGHQVRYVVPEYVRAQITIIIIIIIIISNTCYRVKKLFSRFGRDVSAAAVSEPVNIFYACARTNVKYSGEMFNSLD
jgi:hypothetical protein